MFRVLMHLWKKGNILTGVNDKAKAVVLFALLLWYSASGFLYFELSGKPDLGWMDALWWSMVTMATVGYGDIFPVTSGGRYLVGVPTMIFGIGFLGYLISEIAGTLIESRSKRQKGMLATTLKDHILIINYHHLATVLKLIRELKADKSTKEKGICIVDETLDTIPEELFTLDIQFVKGDPTRKDVLMKANIAGATHVVIMVKDPGNPHSDDQNLATTLVIESMNPKVFSVVEVINAEKIRQLELAGANSVICASEISSGLIIQELQDPGVQNIIKDLVSDVGGHQIYFIPIRKLKRWDYAELVQWGLGNKCTVIGLVRDGIQMLNCNAGEKVLNTDRAVIIGTERPNAIVISE